MLLYDEWVKTYKPIKNPTNDWDGEYSAFETFSPDVDFVFKQPDNLVWTEVDGDGGCYLIAGKHYVNRIQYFVCEVPWTNDNEEVVVQMWVNCECANEDNNWDGDPNCDKCESGTLDFFPDTHEELERVLKLQDERW